MESRSIAITEQDLDIDWADGVVIMAPTVEDPHRQISVFQQNTYAVAVNVHGQRYIRVLPPGSASRFSAGDAQQEKELKAKFLLQIADNVQVVVEDEE